MPKINLARALKEKKRIISRIQEIVSCRHENVYEEDEAPQLDLRCKADEMRFLKGLLVNLKTHIAKANAERTVMTSERMVDTIPTYTVFIKSLPRFAAVKASR